MWRRFPNRYFWREPKEIDPYDLTTPYFTQFSAELQHASAHARKKRHYAHAPCTEYLDVKLRQGVKVILCDVSGRALLSHSLPSAPGDRRLTQGRSGLLMLNNPEKTRQLLTALNAALPFVVKLTPFVKFPLLMHPHMLRHACGYKRANDGQDTRAVQHYLGHKTIVAGAVQVILGRLRRILTSMEEQKVSGKTWHVGAIVNRKGQCDERYQGCDDGQTNSCNVRHHERITLNCAQDDESYNIYTM
jgi:Phage integrase family